MPAAGGNSCSDLLRCLNSCLSQGYFWEVIIKDFSVCVYETIVEDKYNLYFIWSYQQPSGLGLQNKSTLSLLRGRTSPTNVLVMTLNNLMVMLREYGVPFYCHWSQVPSGSTWSGPTSGSNRTVWHLNCLLFSFWIKRFFDFLGRNK